MLTKNKYLNKNLRKTIIVAAVSATPTSLTARKT